MEIAAVVEVLAAEDRARLLDRAVHKHLAAGDIVHLAGDEPDRLHLVTSGVVKLSLRDSEGEETILGLAPAGTVVGDIGAIDGRPQPLDAVAATSVEVLGIDAQIFVEIVMHNPSAALELSKAQAERSRWTIETALERTSGEVSARLAGRLLDLGEMLGTMRGGEIEMDLPVGQRDLGRLAGVCRESTCKTLRRMQADGLVAYRGRKLRILRPDSLQMLRCGMGA
ncbi:MAG: family transcriptional regulator, cyclic receptor protein [Actinomycetota bacterium]|jgi:CRP/FNR family transcriptional regulator|nr:family transcriptional regulator, cyclic receptor protein [Actinomycetota bacterium]